MRPGTLLSDYLGERIEFGDVQACWPWAGSIKPNGYGEGNHRVVGRFNAHRLIYALLIGPIPAGHDVDHECHNADAACPGGLDCDHRRCVNPFHLRATTRIENLHAGRKPGRKPKTT